MKYVTPQDSKTGRKLEKFFAKLKRVKAEAKALANTLNVERWHEAYWRVGGGMIAVEFKAGVTPCKKTWKPWKDKTGFWCPNMKYKEGKDMDKLMSELPTIHNSELNSCIGWKADIFKTIGVDPRNKALFGIEVEEEWKIKMPTDCREVTVTEYNKLFKDEGKGVKGSNAKTA